MTIVTYTAESLVCPHCKHRPVFGYRWFGPAQVQCGYCKAVLSTNLPGWDDLDQTQKHMMVFREILNPSWFGVRGFSGYLLHLVFLYPFISAMLAMPFIFIAMILMSLATSLNGSVIGAVVGLIIALLMLLSLPIGFITVLAWNILRLKRMIDESRKYKLDNKPPVWKKFAWRGKQKGEIEKKPHGNRNLLLMIGAVTVVLFIVLFGCVAVAALFVYTSSMPRSYQAPTVSEAPWPTAPEVPWPTVTSMPSATPRASTVYDKYSAASMTTDQIEADSMAIDWEDFIRNPDKYENKLINVKANVMTPYAQDYFDRNMHGYEINLNPAIFPSNMYNGTTSTMNEANYGPQFAQLEWGRGLLNGDEIMVYGVYAGDTTEMGYPKIRGVYIVRYTSN